MDLNGENLMASLNLIAELLRSKLARIPGLKDPSRDTRRFSLAVNDAASRRTWRENFDLMPARFLSTFQSVYNPTAVVSGGGTVADGIPALKLLHSMNTNWIVTGDNAPGATQFVPGGIRLFSGAAATAKTILIPRFASTAATPTFTTTGADLETGATGTSPQSSTLSSPIALEGWDYDRNPYIRAIVRMPSAALMASQQLAVGFRSTINSTLQSAFLGASGTGLGTSMDPGSLVSGIGNDDCYLMLETGALGVANVARGATAATSGFRLIQSSGSTSSATQRTTPFDGVGLDPTGKNVVAGQLIDLEIEFAGGIGARRPTVRINGNTVLDSANAPLQQRAIGAWTANTLLLPFIAVGGNAKAIDVLYLECGLARQNAINFISGPTANGAALLTD